MDPLTVEVGALSRGIYSRLPSGPRLAVSGSLGFSRLVTVIVQLKGISVNRELYCHRDH